MSSSVGIIGGADGPTAIFMAGDAKSFIIFGIILVILVVAILGLVAFLISRKK